MNKLKSAVEKSVWIGLSLQLLCLNGAVCAEETKPLEQRQAVLDNSPSPPPPPSPRLNGAVSTTDSPPAPPGESAGDPAARVPAFDPMALFGDTSVQQIPGGKGKITIDDAQMKGLMDIFRTAKMTGNFNITINGRTVDSGALNFGSRRPEMSSDDFRKLEHGIIGMDSTITFGSDYPVVTRVIPDCPAAMAGMRPGDVMIKAGDHVFRRGEGQAVTWRVVGGKAGTPVDITVLRDGQELTFHLIRMNIEDIKDDQVRMPYENLLRILGAPGQ